MSNKNSNQAKNEIQLLAADRNEEGVIFAIDAEIWRFTTKERVALFLSITYASIFSSMAFVPWLLFLTVLAGLVHFYATEDKSDLIKWSPKALRVAGLKGEELKAEANYLNRSLRSYHVYRFGRMYLATLIASSLIFSAITL